MYTWRTIEVYRVYRSFGRSLATYDNLWHAKKCEKMRKKSKIFEKKIFWNKPKRVEKYTVHTKKNYFGAGFTFPDPLYLAAMCKHVYF